MRYFKYKILATSSSHTLAPFLKALNHQYESLVYNNGPGVQEFKKNLAKAAKIKSDVEKAAQNQAKNIIADLDKLLRSFKTSDFITGKANKRLAQLREKLSGASVKAKASEMHDCLKQLFDLYDSNIPPELLKQSIDLHLSLLDSKMPSKHSSHLSFDSFDHYLEILRYLIINVTFSEAADNDAYKSRLTKEAKAIFTNLLEISHNKKDKQTPWEKFSNLLIQHKKVLLNLRKSQKEMLSGGDQTTPTLIPSLEPYHMQSLQFKSTISLIQILKEIFESGHTALLPKKPKNLSYCIIGMGSMGRYEMTAFSDFEFLIAVNKDTPQNKAFCQKLVAYLRLYIVLLEEDPMRVQVSSDKLVNGLSLDMNCIPFFSQVTGSFELFGEIPTLLSQQKNPLDRTDLQMMAAQDLEFVYGDKTLFDSYQVGLRQILESSSTNTSAGAEIHSINHRQTRALFFYDLVKQSRFTIPSSLAPEERFSTKTHFYLPLRYWLATINQYMKPSEVTMPQTKNAFKLLEWLNDTVFEHYSEKEKATFENALGHIVLLRTLIQFNTNGKYDDFLLGETKNEPSNLLIDDELKSYILEIFESLASFELLVESFVQHVQQHAELTIDDASKFFRNTPFPKPSLYSQAHLRLLCGKYDASLSICNSGLALSPDDAKFTLLKSLALFNKPSVLKSKPKQHQAEAIELLNQYITTLEKASSPNISALINAYRYLGDFYATQKKNTPALKAYESAVHLVEKTSGKIHDGELGLLYFNLAKLLLASNKKPLSITNFEAAIAHLETEHQFEKLCECCRILGPIYEKGKKPSAAIQIWQTGLKAALALQNQPLVLFFSSKIKTNNPHYEGAIFAGIAAIMSVTIILILKEKVRDKIKSIFKTAGEATLKSIETIIFKGLGIK